MTPSSDSRPHTAFLAVAACLAVLLLAGVVLAGPAVGTDTQFAAPTGTPAALDGAVQPRVVDAANTSNYLQPDADETVRSAVARQDVDVGVAVAAGTESLDGNHERMTLEDRLDGAANQSARSAILQAAVERLAERTDRLRNTRLESMNAYHDGSLSARAYFQRAARIDAAVDRAEADRGFLESQFDGRTPSPGDSLTTLRYVEADLDTMAGPVTHRVQARHVGNVTPGATYVRVTDTGGFVHATIADGVLIREAQETNDWSRDGADEFNGGSGNLTGVLNRVGELYPWTFSHQFGSQSDFFGTSLYKIGVAHQQGELTVYLDGGTDDVFREVQANRLNAVPKTWTRSAVVDGRRLTVNGSSPTGPLEVSMTGPPGDGIESTVRIDGTYVGDSDGEGRLWTVQPTGAFTVNATTPDNETVTITVPADVE